MTSCFEDGPQTKRHYVLEANFQYEGIVFNADSTLVNTQQGLGFGFDGLNFLHQLDADNIWFDGGFILSCAEMPKSGNTENLFNLYRANVPKGQVRGNIYTVFYQNPDPLLMPKHDVEFAYAQNGTCVLSGCYVTNTVEVADFMKKNFKEGDRFAVKAIGYLNGKKTGDAEIALADFTPQKDSIVSKWTSMDLSKLGAIDYVDFEIISTNPDVPTYFCMDNMKASVSIEY
jgi:hypothetical protein